MMSMMARHYLLLFFLLTGSARALIAQVEAFPADRIDSLFLAWNQPDHPGGVVGLMEGDQIRFLRAYGLASLEYRVPNTTETIFNIASVSKQFTAMGIVRLHQAGKLSVDDDIRKYIDDLPDLGHTVTIRHMLHHTSGLRSLHALLGLAGWRGDDARTNEDLYRFMARQQDLNFVPGEEYLYCNTGYIFMARIIETVTGEPFADWMKKEVFEPLGMTQTYVEEQYNRVVPQNATSYAASPDRGFVRSIEYWGYTGSGNMHATVRDLLTWLANFYNARKGWEESFALLQTLDPFNDGRENNYAFGLNVGEFNGLRRIGHGGSIGGFRSNIAVFPEKELGIVVLSNFSRANPGGKLNAVAEMLLGKASPEAVEAPGIEPVAMSRRELKKLEGYFWNDRGNYVRRVYLRADTLRYFRTSYSESPLLPVGKGEFRLLTDGPDLVRVSFAGKGKDRQMLVTVNDAESIEMQWFPADDPGEEELLSYAGAYFSPELETTYSIRVDSGLLTAYHPRHGSILIRRIKENVLQADYPLGVLKFKRDEDGRVLGLYATNGRVRNLWMEKIPPSATR